MLRYKTYIVLTLSYVLSEIMFLRLFYFCFQFYLALHSVYLVLCVEYLCFLFILYCCSVSLLSFKVCLILNGKVTLKSFVAYLCCFKLHCFVERFTENYVHCLKSELVLL